VSRPADWSPLSDGDPVPGNPEAVAALGAQMRTTADRIDEDVRFLRSVCSSAVWESEAGDAFRAKGEQVASKLHRAHARYAVTADVLGDSLSGSGYAAALFRAQSMAGQALSEAQETWPRMTALLAQVGELAPGKDPFGSWGGTPSAPPLGSGGFPVLMVYSGTDKPAVSVAKRQYNEWAQDLSSAVRLLGQAVALQNDAAASAAARIEAVISSDGLQDPTGWGALWDDVRDGLDDVGRYWAANWQRLTSDLANVLSWIATAAGLLAMIFAFICPALAAVLEAVALVLNVVCLVLHTILALTGYVSWLSVCTDVLAIASDGLGAGALGGVKATAELAEGVEEGAAVTAEATTETEAEGGELALGHSFGESEDAADSAANSDETQSALGHRGYEKPSGYFGKLSKEDFQGLNPRNMVHDFKTVWQENISGGNLSKMFQDAQTKEPQVGKTLGGAMKQAFTLHSAEIGEEAAKLDDPATISQLTRLARTQYMGDIAHYTRLWDVAKTVDLTTDGLDKLNMVTEYMGGHLPVYSHLEDLMRTGGSGG
jgi:hypothetical protein